MFHNEQVSELRNSQESTALSESEFSPFQDITNDDDDGTGSEQLCIVGERKREYCIQLGDEKAARRRRLATVRQRRYRERQRTLLGLPEQRKPRFGLSSHYGETLMQLEATQDKPVRVPLSEHA